MENLQKELRPKTPKSLPHTVIGLTIIWYIYMATCTQCYTKIICCVWPDQRLEMAYHISCLHYHGYAHRDCKRVLLSMNWDSVLGTWHAVCL